MIKHFGLLLCLASCLASPIISYEGYKVLRVQIPDKNLSEKLHHLVAEEDFWSDLPGKHADLMVAPKKIEEISNTLRRLGFEFSIMIENLNDIIRLEKVSAKTGFEPKADNPMTWTEYHPVADFDAYLAYLEKTYPALVSLENIGKSYEGRNMTVAKICQGGCGTGNKSAIWIDGGIHAREWISPAVVSFMINQLVETEDPSTSDLLKKLDWYFLPIVNPDGYEYTRATDRLWRKTRSNYGGSCDGTDANRNYDFHFEAGGSSSCSDTYQGPNAFSEVENQHIRDFIKAHNQSIKFFDSIHSYSQLILLPWGYTDDVPPTFDKMKKFADTANAALKATHDMTYDVGTVTDLLYVAPGISLDWAYGEIGIPYSFSIELRDTGNYGFLLPPDQIIPTGEELWAFHKSAANQIITEFGN